MVAVALLTGPGCASAPAQQPRPSASQFAAAQAAVDVARRTATAQSQAPMQHLRAAESELVQARRLLQTGDNRGATWALARAQVDADLSRTLVRQAREEAEAQRLEGELALTRAEAARRPQEPGGPEPTAVPPPPPEPAPAAPAAPGLPEHP
jgi:hypothetical protein